MGIVAKAGSFFPKTTWRDTVVSQIWMEWPRTKKRHKRCPHSPKLPLSIIDRYDTHALHQEAAMLPVGLAFTHSSTLKLQRTE